MAFKHDPIARRKLSRAIRQAPLHWPAPLPRLLVLSDPARLRDLRPLVARLPKCSGVILRHFGDAKMIRQAQDLANLCRRFDHSLLIAADPHLARAVGADGVHWPESRLSQARRWRGRFKLQTASAHSRRAIARVAEAGMDAALVSTVFPSKSPSAGHALGTLRFRRLADTNRLPLYALGGVVAENAERIARAGGLAGIDMAGRL